MGRIKSTLVKRTARKLMEAYSDSFSVDFKKNKDALSGVADIPSKKLRNVIAGLLVRMVKQREKL